MPGPDVMLASLPKDTLTKTLGQLTRDGWWFEIKFDGIRAAVSRTSRGDVVITNRRQVNITHRYPDVAQLLSQADFTGTLDGEIVVMREGKPSFELAHLRDAQSAPFRIETLAGQYPATFIPFDVLELDGRDLRSLPYVERREFLETVPLAVSAAEQDGHLMWEFVVEHELEGLIAKRGDSAYRSGRQQAWVKLKQTRRISALMGAIVPGRGSRGPVGAIQLFLYDDDSAELVGIGLVGSGMKDSDMRILDERSRSGEPTVIEVEFLEVSSSGLLRMPVFRGIRHDIAPESCTLDTLSS